MIQTAYTPEFALLGCGGPQDPARVEISDMQRGSGILQNTLVCSPGGEIRDLREFPILFGLYQGKSLVSKAIQFRTWSKYSHVASIHPDGSVVEAWVKSATVRRTLCPSCGHQPGTVIDCFAWPGLTHGEVEGLHEFYVSQVGKPYDFLGALGFLRRRHSAAPGHDGRAWFCSELAFAGSIAIRKPLLMRIPAWKVYPGMFELSPRLEYVGKITTGGVS